MPSTLPPRRVSRDLRRLARACGVVAAVPPLVASGLGCFLFIPCDESQTRLVEVTRSEWEPGWLTATAPGAPFTGAWLAEDSVRLAGPSGVARSFDGGETWEPLPAAPAGVAGIDGPNGWETWMVGAGGLVGVWRTGRFEEAPRVTDADLADVSVDDNHGGVAVGAGGVVVTSEDGVAWAIDADAAALVEAEGGGDLRAVEVLGDGTVWIAGDAGLLLHRGADGWERVDLGTDADLRDLAFASRDRGVVVDADGVVWWTHDRGATWEATAAPGDVRAVAYDWTDAGPTAWAVGAGGEVWSTGDGPEWREEARTADGSALATVAAADGYVVAAGTSGAVVAYGLVEHTFTELVEESGCQPYVGRPCVVDGVARLPAVVDARADARWLRQAREEHASVAAFARFTLQLLALGAPADLVADAVAAQGDELRHAAMALARAGGGALGPMDLAGDDGPVTLVAVALATAREGCIAETAAVHAATEAAAAATDAGERRFWRVIVADETRHAALAWRFLRWAVARDASVLDAVAPLFATRPTTVPPAVWHAVIAPAAASLRAAA